MSLDQAPELLDAISASPADPSLPQDEPDKSLTESEMAGLLDETWAEERSWTDSLPTMDYAPVRGGCEQPEVLTHLSAYLQRLVKTFFINLFDLKQILL